MTELITITRAPVVDVGTQRLDVTAPLGSSIRDMIGLSLPGLSESDFGLLRVSLVNNNGVVLVSQKYWSVTKPRAGVRVVIRIVPAKDTLRTVLMVVVSVAAMAVGQYWVAPLLVGAGMSATAAGLLGGLAAAGLTALGALLVNALIPPAKPTFSNQDQKNSYQLSGWRNRVPTALDVVPWIAGKHRYAPPFAATSYTEIVGDYQYIRALFTFGYGPVLLSDLRIGDTSLDDYDEVEIEVREGRAGDDPITLYPRQVIEESVSVELVRPYPRDDDGEILKSEATEETPIVRQTAANASSASVIIAFQSGLFLVDDNGNYKSLSVKIRIRQRLYGETNWTVVTTLTISAKKSETFFRQHTWELPSRGRYEIEVTRITDERTSTQLSDRCVFAGLQSIRPEYPINFDKPIALVALRIKATYQLNGALDNFNALAQREMPVFTGTNWVDGNGSNPASAYVRALKGKHNPFPVSDDQINLGEIAEWYQFCATKGLKFDYVFDEPVSLGDMLATICSAGRATPRHDGTKWTVVVDRPTDLVIDHMSPRNSSDFSWQRIYFDPPDAFRIDFKDATNNYEPATRIVPWPGFVGTPDVTEEISLPGKTDPDEIWIEGRRRAYELLYRPDSYSAIQSGAARVATRGDLVMGSYDVIARTQVSARVISVSDHLVELDDRVRMDAGQSYGIRFKTYSYDDDGTEYVSFVTSEVHSYEGEWTSINIKDKSNVPTVGDLIHFGPLANVSRAYRVKGIEPAENFSGVVHMIDAAPEIDDLTDAEIPPAWDGYVGEEVDGGTVAPAIPVVTSVAHGYAGTGDIDGLTILLSAGTGSAAVTSFYEIDHKLSSSTVWTTKTIPVANGGDDIDGYSSGEEVDIRIRAATLYGVVSEYTATITITIGSEDPALPTALDDGLITVIGSLGHATIALTTTSDVETSQLQLYRVPTGSALDRSIHAVGAAVAVAPSSSVNMTDGDSTRATLLSNGAFGSVSSWTLGTGWSITGGKASHASGAAGDLEQTISFTAGKYYRLGYVVSGMTAGALNPLLSGGSDQAGASVSADGSHLDRIGAVTGNSLFSLVADADFDGSVDDVVLFEETGACVDQGIYDYYIEPQNADGNPGPVSGPFTASIT
nr:host specificity factor TipJ family phage tail protein [uncultured Cohaesibacter sp.]